ncbi:cytidylyltransferase domain-containing protein [Paenibacillus agricola]|uniref:Acylneuraminate cytidylyltransferase n=1 Tax=Paenibacillus agricola TaxID=2716264 RepID=A0ABX0JJA4_9BACL|nr:glycosyltransferase family protein [Paenibacillus agricola]NHN33885.1 acylneuraminate cytidylyltransferase [Paenibacillus agricola]
MKTVVIIQARMGSTRLPGKVLRKLCDHTVLGHVLLRTQAIPNIDEVIVATTDLSMDDAIEEEAYKYNSRCIRGSENDVLSRYNLAAIESGANHIIRVTSDCPLIDPDVCSSIISNYLTQAVDYSSNTIERTFPRGLDVEAFTMEALNKANDLAFKEEYREHVTPFIYRNPHLFTISQWVNKTDYSHFRWTLDTIEDWILIEKIYDRLYDPKAFFSWHDVIDEMKRDPDLPLINAQVEQKKV